MRTLVTAECNGFYMICSILPEISSRQYDGPALTGKYSSLYIRLDQDFPVDYITGEFGEEIS